METDFAPSEQLAEPPQIRLRESENNETEPRAAGTIYKVAIGLQTDSNLPRDNMWVTPHFYDRAGTQSPTQLATQIAGAMTAWLGAPFRGQVKVYHQDFNPSVPHNPLATVDFGTVGSFVTSVGPREIALCLSYFAGQNTKRYRGRLYIPHAWMRLGGGSPSPVPAVRPTSSQMAIVMTFAANILIPPAANGMEWRVASTVDKVSRLVTDYWCDDEWDIIRSRGLRGTTRQAAKT